MRPYKPVALWAVPKSISTAFERVFVERNDFEVFHEPFSASYYYSEDRLSDRYSNVKSEAAHNFQNILASILKPLEKRVFVKDMAYHAKRVMGLEFVSNFANTFIIRNPKYVIASLHKMWPDFTLEETGFEQIYNLFRYATEVNGEDVAAKGLRFSFAAVNHSSCASTSITLPGRDFSTAAASSRSK